MGGNGPARELMPATSAGFTQLHGLGGLVRWVVVGCWWVRWVRWGWKLKWILACFFLGILVLGLWSLRINKGRESTWGHQNPEIEGTFFFCVPSLTRADELRWQVLHFAFFLMSWCNYDFCHTHDPVAVSGSTEKYWKHDAPEVFAILRLEHIEIC